MRKFREIIQSFQAPENKQSLWLKNKSLYYFDKDEWNQIKMDEMNCTYNKSCPENNLGNLASIISDIKTITDKLNSLQKLDDYVQGIDAINRRLEQMQLQLDRFDTLLSPSYYRIEGVWKLVGEDFWFKPTTSSCDRDWFFYVQKKNPSTGVVSDKAVDKFNAVLYSRDSDEDGYYKTSLTTDNIQNANELNTIIYMF